MPRCFFEGSTKRWLWRKESFGQGGTGETGFLSILCFKKINSGNRKWTQLEDVFPIENRYIPSSYVSLLEGIKRFRWECMSSFGVSTLRFFFGFFAGWVLTYMFFRLRHMEKIDTARIKLQSLGHVEHPP